MNNRHDAIDHWRAVRDRDPAADGAFVYAVTTTNVYCRPTCPARRPQRKHVEFFSSPAEAEEMGFRACRRCKPREVSVQQRAIAEVRHLLEHSEEEPTLAELGKATGLTPSHLQRLFKRHTGLSPRQYARALKTDRLQQQLRNGAPVTNAQYEAGFNSSNSLYSSAYSQLGMTPGSYRNGGYGLVVYYAFTESPFGRALLATTDRGVCALRFGPDDATLAELQREFPKAELVKDSDGKLDSLKAVLRGYPTTASRIQQFPLDVKATEFQMKVWDALRQIPSGETRSYQQVAEAIGMPTSARAVARACASNPVALAIPCHRVVLASGKLSGYRWGAERKRTILQRESIEPPAGDAEKVEE